MLERDIPRFLSKISIPSNPNECWIWVGSIGYDSYGRFKNDKKIEIAHRASFKFFNHIESLDRWQFVCHSCDNRKCVNPAHLWLGKPKDNTMDMIRKGRSHQTRKTHCPSGHEYSEENTYKWKGHRMCKICRDRHGKSRYKKHQIAPQETK